MAASMASAIPSSSQVNGEYIRVGDGVLSFSDKAWIGEGELDRLEGSQITLGRDRDISNAVNSAGIVIIRDAQLRYPGGDVSVLLPVSDVVIEYRATVGRYAERRAGTGKSTFMSGYLSTYASVGIPEKSFDFIMKRIRASADPRTKVQLPKVQHNDGYCWMPAKIPHIVKTDALGKMTVNPVIRMSFYDGEFEYDAGNILDVFMNVGKSLVGSCTFSARLKHSRPRNAVDSHQFDLGLTITGFQMMDTTELRSPPLNNIPSGLLVRRAANSELIKMFSSTEGTERDGKGKEKSGDLEEGDMPEYGHHPEEGPEHGDN